MFREALEQAFDRVRLIQRRRRDAEDGLPFDERNSETTKQRMVFPIQWISADARSYRIYTDTSDVPVQHHCRERFFQLALVHLLGFPIDAIGLKCFPDAVYHDAKLVFECDENPEHRSKPHAANYAQRGYYVVRVMAFNGPFDDLRFDPLSPLDTYRRTVEAVRLVLEERRRNYAKNDFSGKIVIVGRNKDDERYGRALIDAIERPGPELTALGRACMRGTIWVQEQSMTRAELFLRQQSRVPSTTAVEASISSLRSKHESYWRALLDSYDADRVYSERIARIERDLRNV